MQLRLQRHFAIVPLALLASAASAADYSDPDWPCIQRKVPEISIGMMWAGPLPDEGAEPDEAQRDLASLIAARRTKMGEVERLVDDYAAWLDAADRADALSALFAEVVSRINAERAQIISGIGRYAHKQADLATRVEAREDDLSALQTVAEPDLDRVEELQDTLAWDVRIFKDRAQALTYVCETPVLLEQRAFAIARVLAAKL